jgi:hypothetical protein
MSGGIAIVALRKVSKKKRKFNLIKRAGSKKREREGTGYMTS